MSIQSHLVSYLSINVGNPCVFMLCSSFYPRLREQRVINCVFSTMSFYWNFHIYCHFHFLSINSFSEIHIDVYIEDVEEWYRLRICICIIYLVLFYNSFFFLNNQNFEMICLLELTAIFLNLVELIWYKFASKMKKKIMF